MSDPQPEPGSTHRPDRAASPPEPRSRAGKVAGRVVLLAAVAVVAVVLVIWATDRSTHSQTDDVFIQAHIVNIAPQLVSGRIVRVVADENDRVAQGELLAEIDPIPYRDKVNAARKSLAAAQAQLNTEEAGLVQVRKEIPIQVEIARRSVAAAAADRVKAERALALTRIEVERGIDQARAAVKAARADLLLAEEEYGRYTRLYQQEASTQQRAQQATRSRESAQSQLDLDEAKLAKSLAERISVEVAVATVDVATTTQSKSVENVSLSQIGYDQLRMEELKVEVRKRAVDQAQEALDAAEHDLEYTQIRAPFPGVVVKRYRNLGDFASPGASILSMYNPDLLYAEANLEETRLPGVAPGNPVEIGIDAFDRPFRGRVVWINKSTGAEFALMPRNVVSGEFTHVVQRVAVRIWIEPDDRWQELRSGLSARVSIAHSGQDQAWADRMAAQMRTLETRYNRPAGATSPLAAAEAGSPPPAGPAH